MQHYYRIGCFLVFNFVYLFPISAQVQIIPDSSLENSSSVVVPNQVINNTPSDIITGGSSRGNTLFHSFQEFNVKNGQGAYFSNPEGITNILSRVTGSNPSNILGKLGVLGNANLFLINPNGIIFGANASLDINSSFLASTANSIKLSNGNEFSATKPQTVPLLTVSVPVCLNFLGNSGSIEVQGVGHTLSTSTTTNFIEGAGGSATGLRLQSGRNIALVGGNVIFNGGIVTAPAGKIEITGIDVGQVTINSIFDNWIFDYSLVKDFRDIQISNLSLLDASGFDDGIISLQGDRITITDNSYALIQSQNSIIGGNINVNAWQSLSIIGNTFNSNTIDPFQAVRNRTGVVSENFSGQGANINISTKDLLLQFAGGVVSNSLFSGFGGNVTIDASNSIQVIGASPIDPINSFSVIATNASGFSNSGNITLLTNNLLVEDGGSIFSGTFGAGSSGNININSPGSVLVKGSRNFAASAFIRNVTASGSAPSAVTSSSYGSGAAGDIVIDTPQLTVLDGASISTSTVASRLWRKFR
jgi:filamentous hemagglutinin family protein